ncbi:MAG: DnaJ domain-containing protein [Clostridia bacterium]|nr:DnaJ domain-containing protein [Clostridia bacterium]
MLKEYYQVLGVSESATDEELEKAYQSLTEKYREDRWLEGEAGNEAAKMLTKVEVAYREIVAARKQSEKREDSENSGKAFEDIAALLKEGKINEAQARLDDFNERSAEWHYLQSVVFYKKNWTNESKKQLEIAMQLDPSCVKYRDAYGKLNAKAGYDKKAAEAGQNPYSSSQGAPIDDSHDHQMGGNACSDCCSCCYTYLCVDCLFSLCCGCR